jgi:hypoxanthine phosphoribosyltransferase
MTAHLKEKPEYWGPIGLLVTLILAGIGFYLLNHPESSDLMTFIVFSLAGVLLLAVSIFTLYKPYRSLKRDIGLVSDYIRRTEDSLKDSNSISWQQFSFMMLDLLTKILLDGYSPDLVLGIGRSGGIVATMMAGCLKSCPVLVVDVDIDKKSKTRTVRPESEKALKSIDEKAKILVVMADVITGGSIREVLGKMAGSVEYKIAALYRSPSASIDVDFSVINAVMGDARAERA